MALAKLLLVLSPSQGAKGHREWLYGLFPCLPELASQSLGEEMAPRPERLHNSGMPGKLAPLGRVPKKDPGPESRNGCT